MFQLTVDRFPTGKFGFVGSNVPAELAYVWEHGEDLKHALQCGPGVARKTARMDGRTFDVRVWDTREAALADAAKLGLQTHG